MSSVENRLNKFLSSIKYCDEQQNEDLFEAFYKIKDIPSSQKEIYKYQLTDGREPAYIIPLSDIHLGNKVCNIEKLESVLQLILNTKNCYTILIGDLAETATRESVGNAMFDEDLHAPDQLKVLYAILKPLADANKILGVLTGNHEMRIEYLTGLNPMKLLADKLDVPYFGYQGYIQASVGDITYDIMCHHGVGGGSTMAAKIKAIEKLNQVTEADIYIAGHTHGLHHHYDQRMEFGNDGVIIPKRRHYVIAGSFLDYWNGYAEMKVLQPSDCGSALIELRHDHKDIRVTI